MTKERLITRHPSKLALSALALATCMGSSGAFGAAPPITGNVNGGGQGVIGAQVTVFAAGANPGDAAVELGSAVADANGDFSVALMAAVTAGDLVDGQLVYLTATGGDAGGGVNNAISLMTVAGPFCDTSQSDCDFPANVTVNELSTVAATATLQDFITFVDCTTIANNSNAGTCIAITGATGLKRRAATFDVLVDAPSGQASAFLVAATTGSRINFTRRRLNTLGNILAGCVVTNGPASASCSTLFDITLSAENTLLAAFQIAAKPAITRSGDELFALQAAPLTYTPTLTAAPDSWTVGGQRFTFAANPPNNTVSVYRRSAANGVLVPIDLTVMAGNDPEDIARTPDGAFALVANQLGDSVSAYAIDPASGAFTEVAGSPFAAGNEPFSVAVAPDGDFAYAAGTGGSFANGSISAYRIDPATGVLTPVAGSPFAAGTDPIEVAVAPDGDHVYVADLSDNVVSVYSVNPTTGALIAGSSTATGGGPTSIALSPDGAFAYVANQVDNSVSVYSINPATGALTEIASSPFAAGDTPFSMALSPDGAFALVANLGGDDVSAYTVNAATGALTAVTAGAGSCGVTPDPGNCVDTGSSPRAVMVTPSGAFAYVVSVSDGIVSGYAIDQTSGALTEIDVSSPFFGVDDGRSVAAAPGGRFIYVGNVDANDVSGFAIDPVTGALTEVPGSPFMADDGPRGIAVDPDGDFVYAVNAGGANANNISGYRVDPANGALDPLPGFPISTLQNPRAVTFHPDGDTLYVANSNADRVTAYAVNPTTGALTQRAGSPYSAGNFPTGIAVTPDGEFAYVSNGLSDNVSAYSIAASGALSPITSGGAGSCGPNVSVDPGNCFAVGNFPDGLAVSPDGGFVYVPNISGDVSVFSIDPNSGALSEISGSPFAAGNGPAGATVSPDGAFVYVGAQGFGFSPEPKVFAYSRNPATGALSAVMGSPFDSSSQSLSIAVEPTGRFIYVPGAFDDPGTRVTGFSIDPVTGVLTKINIGSPFPLGLVSPPGSADLSVTKTDSPDPVAVGGNLTYTVTVHNNGPASATGVTLTDTLPSGVIFVSATPAQGSCTGTSTITCNLGTLAVAGEAQIAIVVTPTAEGDITNTAQVSANETDPDQTNNSAVELTAVGIVTVAIGDVSMVEGDAGTTVFGFAVTLDDTAGQPITVSFDTADGTATAADNDFEAVTGGSVTIAAGDTTGTAQVTINGDNVFEGDETFTVTLTGVTSGPGVIDGANATGTGTIQDDDPVTVTFNPAALGTIATVPEGAGVQTVPMAVTLSNPTAGQAITVDVAIDGASTATNGADFNFTDPTTVSFAAGEIEAELTLDVLEDSAAEGSETVVFNLTNISGPAGAGSPASFTTTILDNDAPGITVDPTAGLITTEAGGTSSFTVVLNSQPAADVTVGLTSSDITEGTVTPTGLTFTSANWNIARTVTVTGVNDLAADGGVAFSIVTASGVSSDPNYNNVDPADVGVTNQDDDSPGITVTPTSGLTTTEAGGTASFTVVLNTQPVADASIALSSDDTSEGTVTPTGLTFTTANWNQAQTVTVTGVDDLAVDGDVAFNIVTASAISSDPNYNNVDPADVAVTNQDDDSPGITVTPTSGLTTTEAGGTASFTVVLNSQPAAAVTVGLTSSDPTEGMVSPAGLTFTTANWNTARIVTVTGVDDTSNDGDVAFNIVTAPAISTDPSYSNTNPADVAVTNQDDDALVTVTQLSLSVSSIQEENPSLKSAHTSQVTATLSGPAVSDVTVTLGFSGQATLGDDFTVTGNPITIAAGDTQGSAQLSAVNDAVVEGDESFTVTAQAVTGAELADPSPEVTGTIVDDDQQLTASATSIPALSPLGLLLLPLLIPIAGWRYLRRRLS